MHMMVSIEFTNPDAAVPNPLAVKHHILAALEDAYTGDRITVEAYTVTPVNYKERI